MIDLLLLGMASALVLGLSWKYLLNPLSHGFYRFFNWECILLLLLFNYKFWLIDPFSLHQIILWIFLFASIYLVIASVLRIKSKGKQSKQNDGFARCTL